LGEKPFSRLPQYFVVSIQKAEDGKRNTLEVNFLHKNVSHYLKFEQIFEKSEFTFSWGGAGKTAQNPKRSIHIHHTRYVWKLQNVFTLVISSGNFDRKNVMRVFIDI